MAIICLGLLLLSTVFVICIIFTLYWNTDGKNDSAIDALYWVVSKHTRTTDAYSFQELQLDELI